MSDHLIEGSLIDPVYGDIFLKNFPMTLKKDSEWFCLKLPILIDIVMGMYAMTIIDNSLLHKSAITF